MKAFIQHDISAWASLDLPYYPQRRKHPIQSRAELVLFWIDDLHDLRQWQDFRPFMLADFMRHHQRLQASTLQAYGKAVRRWLRWHERNDVTAPILSTRCAGLAPKNTSADPFIPDASTWTRLLHRSRWIHRGSRSLSYTVGNRTRVPCMADWPHGAFTLWLLLGSELGLRPWELAFLHRSELERSGAHFTVKLKNHEARSRKTPLAGTPLLVPAPTSVLLAKHLDENPGEYLFAIPSDNAPSGWRPPNYDQIWAALRQEFGSAELNGRILRRMHATAVSRANPNILEVATATRHVRLDTLRHYVQRHGVRVIDPSTGKSFLVAPQDAHDEP